MNEIKEQTPQYFLDSIADLYKSIEGWVKLQSISITREEVELNEEFYGIYKADKLVLKRDGVILADIIPIGARVIGANGRVDMVGEFDKVIILYFEKSGPAMTTTTTGIQFPSVYRFFRDVKERGWYWLEDTRREKAHKLDRELFYELLTEVSDYEF